MNTLAWVDCVVGSHLKRYTVGSSQIFTTLDWWLERPISGCAVTMQRAGDPGVMLSNVAMTTLN